MSLKFDTVQTLKVALASEPAANDLVTSVNAGGGGSLPQNLATTDSPTFAALTLTGIATVGSDVKIASGHTLKVNNISVVGAQAANITTITTTYTAGSAPTPGSTQTIANSATPTAVELLAYIANVDAKHNALLAALKTHGLIASS